MFCVPLLELHIPSSLKVKRRSKAMCHSRGGLRVKSGVPHGSILGPLLFLMYINDTVKNLSDKHIFLYADNTKIGMEVNSINDCVELQTPII